MDSLTDRSDDLLTNELIGGVTGCARLSPCMGHAVMGALTPTSNELTPTWNEYNLYVCVYIYIYIYIYMCTALAWSGLAWLCLAWRALAATLGSSILRRKAGIIGWSDNHFSNLHVIISSETNRNQTMQLTNHGCFAIVWNVGCWNARKTCTWSIPVVSDIPVSVKNTLLLREPLPCSPAAETALQPLIWCSESPSCKWLLLRRTGMIILSVWPVWGVYIDLI